MALSVTFSIIFQILYVPLQILELCTKCINVLILTSIYEYSGNTYIGL